MPVFTKTHQKIEAYLRNLFNNRTKIVTARHDYILMQRVHGKRVPTLRQMRFIAKVLTPAQKALFRVSLTVFIFSFIFLLHNWLLRFQVEVPKVGGEYIEGIVGQPRLINPLFATTNETDMALVRMVYSGLVRTNEQQNSVPDLADNYTVSDDQKMYTFNLHPGIVWHDGTPLTAQDVAYTIELIQDPSVSSPLSGAFAGVRSTVISDTQIQFTLPAPSTSFLSVLTVGILPRHIWSSVARDQIRLAEINLKPIGSGPFQFKRLIKDETGVISRYELTRFTKYHRQTAYIKDFIFQFYADYEGDGGALEALRTQKIAGLHFIPALLKEKTALNHVTFATLQVPQYTALFFNLRDKNALEDKTLRQTLAGVINKAKILQETLHGDGSVIDGPILRGFPGYSAPTSEPMNVTDAANDLDKKWPRLSAEEYKQNLIDAYIHDHSDDVSASSTASTTAALLASATAVVEKNLPPAQLYFRTDAGKKNPLVIHLVTLDTPEYRHTAALIAGYWQDIGVRTDTTFVEQKEMATTLKNRDYDVLLYGVIVGNDPDQYPFWHSSQVAYPGLNLAGYTNHKVDDILVKIRSTNDQKELDKLYAHFQSLLIADMPAVFMYSPTYTYVLGNNVHGFKVERITHPADRFSNITDWYIKTGWHWKFN
jgi:peptide/nickel transport system substrate-binding protein